MTISQRATKRKYNTEQSLYKKSSLKSPLQLSFQADLNNKIQSKNEICSQTTKKNIYFEDGLIKTQSRKEITAQTSSVKWGKYFVEGNEEHPENSTQTSLTWFPTKSSGCKNSEPKSTHFSGKNHENKRNVQTPEKSTTNIYANRSFPGLSYQIRNSTLSDKLSSGVKYLEITTEQQSNKQQLVSSQGFECDYNFTDVDFQLDF